MVITFGVFFYKKKKRSGFKCIGTSVIIGLSVFVTFKTFETCKFLDQIFELF